MDDEQKMSFRLDQMKWDKRPFLIFAADQDTSTYEQQIASLNGLKLGLSARDMAIISVFGNDRATVDGKEINQESIQRLRSEFQVPTDQFTVILVGKDGTEKLRRKTPVALREIFALIDSMPMRQREMRQDDSR